MADGAVRTPLDEADARRAIRELAARGVTTLAVCLLHAYVNPAHERRIAALVAEEAPDVTVTLSHEVSPTFREYERTSTNVVNAYVMSIVRDYLRGLASAMSGRGYRGRLFVMQSSGGIATAEAMQRYPVRMIESGPAAGALMAAAYGELTGHRDLIAFDMGGTTAKLALIESGRPATTTSFELHRVHNAPGSGLPMNIQAIDLVEIGAGGGSIARAKLGVIAVGPESASSTPGPVCYGRGGEQPTVTDADVVLGYVNPDYFAGGSMKLQAGAAARAIEELVARPPRALARGRRLGHPHDRQHEHGAGNARGLDRARPRPARSDAGRVRRLGAGARMSARPGARNPARRAAGLGRGHRGHRFARRRGEV
jgi:N-methylhydantoinase A